MPVYELFCLALPALARSFQASVIRTAAAAVQAKGGLLTGITSFGDQPLAYAVRRPGEKYNEAFMWQMGFVASPELLGELEHLLKVDEKVLRYVIQRKRAFRPFPNTYRIARQAKRVFEALDSPT